MTEKKEFCENCQRWLEHEIGYCPLFPNKSPTGPKETGKKWDECICLMHTCYQAPKRRSRKGAPTYRD